MDISVDVSEGIQVVFRVYESVILEVYLRPYSAEACRFLLINAVLPKVVGLLKLGGTGTAAAVPRPDSH